MVVKFMLHNDELLEGFLLASSLTRLSFLRYLEALLRKQKHQHKTLLPWSMLRPIATHLGTIKDRLDLLQQAPLILLQRRIRLHRLLDQELNIPQLAEVEIPLAFQPLHRLHELRILLRQHPTSRAHAAHGATSPTPRPRRSCVRRPPRSRRGSTPTHPPTTPHSRHRSCGGSFPTGERVVVASGVVLVPVLLAPLQELEVILHLALDEVGDGKGPVDVVFAEGVGEDLEVLEVGVFGIGVEFDA